MNTDHKDHEVRIYCMDGLAVVLDKSKTDMTDRDCSQDEKGDLTGRGDELEEAGELQKIAKLLETEHREEEASVVKEHVRAIVAKQLNELDGFDR